MCYVIVLRSWLAVTITIALLTLTVIVATEAEAIVTVTVNRSVDIDVSANWPLFASHPLTETAEYLYEQSPSLFWSFHEQLCTITAAKDGFPTNTVSSAATVDELLRANSAEDFKNFAVTVAEKILPQSMHSLLHTMLSLRNYYPAMQFHHSLSLQYYNKSYGDSNNYGNSSSASVNGQTTSYGQAPCDNKAFIVVLPAGTVLCELPQDLAAAQQLLQPLLQQGSDGLRIVNFGSEQHWDHLYPLHGDHTSSRSSPTTKVVLYGTIGSGSYCQLHSAVKSVLHSLTTNSDDNSASVSVAYAVRHSFAGQQPIANNSRLLGFGAFLDIKNMEYKNIDESDEEIGDDDEKVAEVLTTAEENNSEMKLRKVKDLCLQIVQLVHAAVSTSMVAAMDKLKELTQNFPTHASVVSTTRVERKLRSEALNWYNSGLMGLLPSNSLYINGRRFDLSGNTFNIFDVLKTCRSELALHQKIVAAGLPLEWQQAVLQLAASVSAAVTDNRKGENIIRIDVSKGGKNVVNFLNNLEKDEMYAMWPKSLRQLLYPSWSIQTIARNIYTLIGVVDLLSEDGANLFMQFNMLYQQQYPIRFGSVFSCSSVISVEHSQNEHFCRLFSHLKSQISSEVAMEFAGHIASNVLGLSQLGEAITVATVDSLYKSFLFERSLEVPRLVIVHDENDVVFQTRQYLEARGLSANSYSLNGIVFQSSTIAPSFMQVLGREQFLVTQLYREGKLKDKLKKSLFSTILAENPGGSFLRYHPVLDQKEPVAIDFNTPAGRQFLSTVSYLQSTSGAGSSMENTKPFANTVNMLVPAATSGAADVLTMMRWFSRKTDNPCRLSFHFYSPSGPYAAISNHVSIDTDGTTSARRIGNFQEELDVLLSLTSALKTVPSVEEANKVALAVFEKIASGAAAGDAIASTLSDLKAGSELAEDVLSTLVLATTDSKVVAVNSQLERQAARYHLLEPPPMLLSFLLSSLVSSAKEEDDDTSSLEVISGSVIVYNTRILPNVVASQLHELDLELLETLEENRIMGNFLGKVESLWTLVPEENRADVVLQTLSYCNSYAVASGGRRVDVASTLNELAAQIGVFPSSEESDKFQAQLRDGMKPSYMMYSVQPKDFIVDHIQVVMMFDPLTHFGQRASSLVSFFRDQLHYPQTIILTPRTEVTGFPLQNFYRYVLSTSSQPNGEKVALARFTNLPSQHTLTARMDVPEPLNVQTSWASQDIDNLRCTATSCGDIDPNEKSDSRRTHTRITYTLKSMIVAGQCFEAAKGSAKKYGAPPNGLQLVLFSAGKMDLLQNILKTNGTTEQTNFTRSDLSADSDTLVMQNLGYFQLQAQPGLFSLRLAEGRASELYTIAGVTGNAVEERDLPIPVRSFNDENQRLVVQKRPGMETVSLLEDTDGEDVAPRGSGGVAGSMWNSLNSIWSGSKAVTSTSSKDEDNRVHVFSLATGHLYERLLRIMMLSVTRHCSRPVKFWLFENYLSPSFKALAQSMTETYGFEVAYVTYKWPTWLTQQTEQQRIIWGYKILFLDVLFPLDVKKVIYVDADQVVRADLVELWERDLEGAPYAYTPFCSSREETLGFQFWRQGYWKEHLRGKPYHISALYVVDLQKFRRHAVGDQLRAVYDQLSRDPNSLSNLDQDLPNYAQHVVPIHSLPQEWLWCESWCADKDKKKAKTIDLCNNPLHKESKLDMAKRVISGKLFNQSWVELDEEIRTLAKSKNLLPS